MKTPSQPSQPDFSFWPLETGASDGNQKTKGKMMGIEIATSADIAEIKKAMLGLASQVQSLTQTIEGLRQEQMPEWLTVKEAATFLRITPDTIRRKVRAGHFDTRREGKNILISRECVLD